MVLWSLVIIRSFSKIRAKCAGVQIMKADGKFRLRSTVLLTVLVAIGLYSGPVQAKYGGRACQPNDP